MLAVRVDNAEQPNSRWYSGCGIYRNVWLSKTGPIHVADWGTYVTTSSVDKGEAVLNLVTTIVNESDTNEISRSAHPCRMLKAEKLLERSRPEKRKLAEKLFSPSN